MSAAKELTGAPKINARGLYSSDTDVLLCLTLCIECNQKPLLDEVIAAVIRRLRVVPFITKSVEQSEYDALPEDERVNVNVQNTYYKSIEFQQKYKQAFFEILKPYAKAFFDNNCALPDVPAECAKQNRDYLAVSDDLYSWFNDLYEPLQKEEFGGALDQVIPLTDIYKNFSECDYYNRLSKIEKRKYNRKGFIETFSKNVFLKKNIKQKDAYYNTKRIKAESIVEWKKRTTENEIGTEYAVEEEIVFEEI